MINSGGEKKISSLCFLLFLVLSNQYFRKLQLVSIKDRRNLADVSIIHFYSLLFSCGCYVNSLHHKYILSSHLHSHHTTPLFLILSALLHSPGFLSRSSFQVEACQDFIRAGAIVYDRLKSLELNILIFTLAILATKILLLNMCDFLLNLIRNQFCIQLHIFKIV